MEISDNLNVKYEKSKARLSESLAKLGGLEKVSMAAVGKVRNKAIEGASKYGILLASGECDDFSEKDLRKYFAKEFRVLKDAYSFGRESLDGGVTQEFLEELNTKVAPEVSELGYGYRKTKMEIRDSDFVPVSEDKVEEKMREYVSSVNENLKSNDKMDLALAAIDAYTNLVEIHPFYKGNGRTSRVVSSSILESAEIPLPVLDDVARREYYPLMETMFTESDSEKKVLKEKALHSFMMDKISDSVDYVVSESQ